jgi:hypothetical protein
MPKGRDYNIFILGQSKPQGLVFKKNCNGPINDAHHKTKKNGLWASPQ